MAEGFLVAHTRTGAHHSGFHVACWRRKSLDLLLKTHILLRETFPLWELSPAADYTKI